VTHTELEPISFNELSLVGWIAYLFPMRMELYREDRFHYR